MRSLTPLCGDDSASGPAAGDLGVLGVGGGLSSGGSVGRGGGGRERPCRDAGSGGVFLSGEVGEGGTMGEAWTGMGAGGRLSISRSVGAELLCLSFEPKKNIKYCGKTCI